MEDCPACTNTSSTAWVWSQHWLDLLFLHWRVPAGVLRSHVPESLEIDLCDGSAWVSVVLFRLRVRPRWLPFVPGLSALIEVNVRTYVRRGDRTGIWFLRAIADNRWAICLARLLTPMPYTYAPLRYEQTESGSCFLLGDGSELAVRFCPSGPGASVPDGSLDTWLLERYRLFARGNRGSLVEATVAHPRWQTRDATVAVDANRLGTAVGIDLSPVPDRVHYSEGVAARFGAFRVIG